ncbi:unnamed protein product [Rangifer tarandus platyrhynchus]|uniref:Uncharacterized protein n=2 Tax=Rangifer tarandus platyrhynchus TaxID=3082113 RepID=A0ABN8Y2U6_RANTA|nr:unnamed protein product [Rangifer tarandus platyrhynchus]
MISPTALVINSLLPPSAFVCLMHPLDKTHPPQGRGLTKTSFFWLELTDLAIAQELQGSAPMHPNKGMCPSSCLFLSVCTLPGLPVWPLLVRHVLPPGPVTNKPLYFKFSCGLLDSVVGSPSNTLCST